jgi:polysaccharide pyruvyl transferase WcaK-like protein
MSTAHNPRRISLFGHFGSLNSGNETTLTTMLAHLRLRFPEAEFLCICTNPQVVAARDGIEATPITVSVGAGASREGSSRMRRYLRSAVREIGQLARAFKAMRGTDVLIVPGTGLVTDAHGIYGWGPLSLFRWALAAKLRRARVAFVSIGAGPFYSRAGRALATASLSLADYRSYRDPASRDTLSQIGLPAKRDPVYPDLVFSLPEAMLPGTDAREQRPRRVVGLGLIADQRRYSTEDPRPDAHTAYLESLAVFVAWLLDHDYDIRLLFGDGEDDPEVLDEFKLLLRQRLGTYDEARIVEQASSTDVFVALAQTDVVVATRFHNVLLSLLLTKPVIAISFHHKCSSLMRQMNLSEYCQGIHEIDADRLIEQFEILEQNVNTVERTIVAGVRDARAALDEQYDRLVAAL